MDSLVSELNQLRDWLAWLPDPVAAALIILLAVIVALLLHLLVRRAVHRLLGRRYPITFSIFSRLRGLTRLAVLIIALAVGIRVAPIDQDFAAWCAHLLLIASIILIGWASIAALHIAGEIYLRRFHIDTADNLLARKHTTQVRVLLRSADVLLALFTIGAALMTFAAVRQYGVSLFASAGVAGLIAGLAARPVLSNLFAGVQLAVTQPIRIGDAVVVEKESGVIEEITSAYVVVRIWDRRRMILPLTYFIEKPFQNWTRDNTALTGVVLFYLDYRAPIAAMREKLKEILTASPGWDGDVMALQVTDSRAATIEVRVLVSARTAGEVFDLRCEVREKMIDFLQREHPESLPRQRSEAVRGAPDGGPPQQAAS
jgi:small-conductance mechanosensitive channel